MLKKSLLSLTLTASLGLSGCNISSTSDSSDAEATGPEDGQTGTYAVFDLLNTEFPLGSDFLFGAQASASVPDTLKDGTADTSNTDIATGVVGYGENAITNALDDLPGGISTVAPIDIEISDSIDESTVVAGTTVYLVRLPNSVDVLDTAAFTVPTGVEVDALDLGSIAALYPSDDTAITGQNLTSTIALQPADTDYEVSVISIDGGTDNVIRIIPTTPLNPKSKYIVVITKGITDTSGNAIEADFNYDYLTDTATEDLWTAGFAGAKASIDGWELLVTTILGTMGEDLSADFALTHGFTTVDPHTVLKSMAYPGYWNAALNAGITAVYEHPQSREYELITNLDVTGDGDGDGVNQLPGVAVSTSLPTTVLISQGAIELPQYTDLLANDSDGDWTANTDVGAVIDTALGNTAGTTPPSDLNREQNVTYRFPFAAQVRTAVVPVLIIEPTTTATANTYGDLGATDSGCTKPVNGWETIIFQHGITVDRGASLAIGSNLAIAGAAGNNCFAVIAIDLPHHGIAPVESDRNGLPADNSRLGLSIDSTAAQTWGVAKDVLVAADADSLMADLTERHEGLYLDSDSETAVMTYGTVEAGTAAGASGDFFLRLDKFQRTRDNLSQTVMDLLNLNATIEEIDVDGDTASDLDEDSVHFVGHSLGAIVGATFVAVNNNAEVAAGNTNLNTIQTATLATPGGSLPKLLESSVSFSASLLPGLAAIGLTQGTSDLESYFGVFQATVDTVDPINFIADLASGGDSETNSLVIEMVGGNAISDTDLASMSDTFQALGTYPSDWVVPNETASDTLASGAERVETARTPMAGTDPLVDLLGALQIDENNDHNSHSVVKFTEGTHGTFASADALAAFSEMVSQVATFIATNGGTVTITDTSVIETVTTE